MSTHLTNMIITAILNNNNNISKHLDPKYYNESYHYPKNKNIIKINKHITYNSKIMRKYHNIKQPGIDIQRKTR